MIPIPDSSMIELANALRANLRYGFQVIRENWNLKYSACFVICPLPKESPMTNVVPEAVSVVARLRAAPTNRILVQNRHESRTSDKQSLAICVKPLHYYYNRVCKFEKRI